MLFHNLKKIKENVEGEFIIIANPQNKDKVSEIAQVLSLNSRREHLFQVVVQQQPKGMADALLSAKEHYY